jgi:hypothetical protein
MFPYKKAQDPWNTGKRSYSIWLQGISFCRAVVPGVAVVRACHLEADRQAPVLHVDAYASSAL